MCVFCQLCSDRLPWIFIAIEHGFLALVWCSQWQTWNAHRLILSLFTTGCDCTYLHHISGEEGKNQCALAFITFIRLHRAISTTEMRSHCNNGSRSRLVHKRNFIEDLLCIQFKDVIDNSKYTGSDQNRILNDCRISSPDVHNILRRYPLFLSNSIHFYLNSNIMANVSGLDPDRCGRKHDSSD